MIRNHCLTIVLAVFTGFLGGMFSRFLIGQSVFAGNSPQTPTEIVAREFRLVDKSGNTRAALKVVEETGETVLFLSDKNSSPSAFLTVKEDGSSSRLVIKNSKSKFPIILAVQPEGGGLLLGDPRKNATRAAFFVMNGQQRLIFRSIEGAGLSIGWERNGYPMLTLVGKDNKSRAVVGIDESGTAAFRLIDKDGKTTWSAP